MHPLIVLREVATASLFVGFGPRDPVEELGHAGQCERSRGKVPDHVRDAQRPRLVEALHQARGTADHAVRQPTPERLAVDDDVGVDACVLRAAVGRVREIDLGQRRRQVREEAIAATMSTPFIIHAASPGLILKPV